MRILVLEDDDAIQAFIVAALQQSELLTEIDPVSNGDDALAQCRRHGSYDVVIADQWHPGMKGIELIDAMREINRAQAVILQSGNFDDLVEAFQQEYPDIPVLEKPFRAQKLTNLVRGMKR